MKKMMLMALTAIFALNVCAQTPAKKTCCKKDKVECCQKKGDKKCDKKCAKKCDKKQNCDKKQSCDKKACSKQCSKK